MEVAFRIWVTTVDHKLFREMASKFYKRIFTISLQANSTFTTLKSFIPIPIINTITQINILNKTATQLTITKYTQPTIETLLYQTSRLEKTNDIQLLYTVHYSSYTQLFYTHTSYTCSMPDQYHNNINNRCSPIDKTFNSTTASWIY